MLKTLNAKINQTTYEIWDESTNEILVDGLTFEDAAEQCVIYKEFFGTDVVVVLRESSKIIKHTTAAQEFKNAWIEYFEEIRAMGNLN